METNFNITNVKKVRTVVDAKSANEFLNTGWVLLETSSGKDESQYPITHYTLGWAGEGEPVEPKRY